MEKRGLSKEEMDVFYGQGEDPWGYHVANRHCITAGLCKQILPVNAFVTKGPSIVEYGCGEGLLLREIRDICHPNLLVGYDICSLAVQRCIEINRVNAYVYDMRDPLPSIKADIIVISDCLAYLDDLEYLEKEHKMLYGQEFLDNVFEKNVVPGGSIVLTSWFGGWGNPLGDVPPGGKTIMELSWSGKGFIQAKKEFNDYQAFYRVIGKPY